MRNDRSSASFLDRLMTANMARSAQDPADYGTAFGLELSMEGGIPHAVDAPASAATPPSAPAPSGWLARWRRPR